MERWRGVRHKTRGITKTYRFAKNRVRNVGSTVRRGYAADRIGSSSAHTETEYGVQGVSSNLRMSGRYIRKELKSGKRYIKKRRKTFKKIRKQLVRQGEISKKKLKKEFDLYSNRRQRKVVNSAEKKLNENIVKHKVNTRKQFGKRFKKDQKTVKRKKSSVRSAVRYAKKNKKAAKVAQAQSRASFKLNFFKAQLQQSKGAVVSGIKGAVQTIGHALKVAVQALVASNAGMILVAVLFIAGLVIAVVPSAVVVHESMDTRNQIIEVALKEVGTISGDKYRTWYTGNADNEMWCATFVSWCAEQCGLIENGVFPKFQGCDEGLAWFNQRGLFSYTPQYDGVEYVPQQGDVIFFTGRGGVYDKNDSTHVGLVQFSENGNVITVEGNSGNAVKVRTYSLTSQKILGYARPIYPLTAVNDSNFSGNTTSEVIWNFLKSQGCSDAAAAGIMGNIQGESSMNPGAIEKRSGPPQPPGHGICQWTGGRTYKLFDRAAAAGKPWQSLEVQLPLLWDEINGEDKATLDILNKKYDGIEGFKNMTSVERATEAFCVAFERPSQVEKRVRQRIPYARKFYALYAGTGGIENGN